MSLFDIDDLTQRTTLAALLFRLEQQPPKPELNGLLIEVLSWFRHNLRLGRAGAPVRRVDSPRIHRARPEDASIG